MAMVLDELLLTAMVFGFLWFVINSPSYLSASAILTWVRDNSLRIAYTLDPSHQSDVNRVTCGSLIAVDGKG